LNALDGKQPNECIKTKLDSTKIKSIISHHTHKKKILLVLLLLVCKLAIKQNKLIQLQLHTLFYFIYSIIIL